MTDPLFSSIMFILFQFYYYRRYYFQFLLYTRKKYLSRVHVGHKQTDTFIFLRHLHLNQKKNLMGTCMLFGIFAVVVASITAAHAGCNGLRLLG